MCLFSFQFGSLVLKIESEGLQHEYSGSIMHYLIHVNFLISLYFAKINIVSGDICDLCSCDGGESDELFLINCTPETKLGTVNVDLENIQWPTINISLEAHFNNMQFNYLPKLLGSANVKIVNLDNNLIDTIKSDPFKQCKNLESLSIANNSIYDLPKGIEANAIMISNR